MKKTKSISDLVTDLQKENEELQFLKKLFEKACITAFGYDSKTIKILLEKQRIYEAKRAEKIAQKSQADANRITAHNQFSHDDHMGERKADNAPHFDSINTGLSAGGYSPSSSRSPLVGGDSNAG